MRAAALLVIAACSSPRPIVTCADSLAGTWRAPSGEWMLRDDGRSIEGYPLFDDVRPETSDAMAATTPLEIAPRSFSLSRTGADVRGDITRRFTRGADPCVSHAGLRVTACSGSTLEVVLSDPAPPIAYAPCEFSTRSNPSRREKWLRVR